MFLKELSYFPGWEGTDDRVLIFIFFLLPLSRSVMISGKSSVNEIITALI